MLSSLDIYKDGRHIYYNIGVVNKDEDLRNSDILTNARKT